MTERLFVWTVIASVVVSWAVVATLTIVGLAWRFRRRHDPHGAGL